MLLSDEVRLKGWTHPLPMWIVTAINEGRLTVNEGKGFQFLLGTVVNPEGTIISFC